MNIKEIFDKAENGTLTFAQFEEQAKEAGAKFADLSEGNYVSKQKYESDLATKDSAIKELQSNIAQRDTDLGTLKTQLENAGTDASKLTELQGKLDTLQSQYEADTKSYQEKLAAQAYEFAVKEFANGKDFSSQAAKRDFIRSLLGEKLKMKGDVIVGAEDFATAYAQDNADAFVAKAQPAETEPSAPAGNATTKPQFVSTTPGTTAQKAPSLTDMMKAANENPGASFF